jgi:hypothetical protein
MDAAPAEAPDALREVGVAGAPGAVEEAGGE